MVVFALLTIGAVLVAVGAGLRILKKEYLPLLQAMDPKEPQMEDPIFSRKEDAI